MSRDALSGYEDHSSSLSPETTGNKVAVRLIMLPLHISGDETEDQADGVIIAGDIINGKLAISHRIVNIFSDGYGALVFYNEDTEAFEVLSSTLTNEDGDIEYDAALDDYSLVEERKESEEDIILTGEGYSIGGIELNIAENVLPRPAGVIAWK